MRDRTTASDAAPDRRDPGLTNVLFDVWLVSRAAAALIDDTIRPSGLDADEFAVYSVLASTDGMTPTELARWMSAPTTTVSSYVKRFERRGHVRRVPNPDDGRSHRVQLTAAGRRAHGEAGERFLPVLQAVEEGLGPRSSSASQQLDAVRRAIDVVATGAEEGDTGSGTGRRS